MKTYIIILLAIFLGNILSGCGSSGGAGGSSGTTSGALVPAIPPHTYKILVTGIGGQFASVNMTNYGTVDQTETDWAPTNLPAGGYDITLFGRSIHMEYLNTGGIPITFELYRDTILTDTYNLNGGESVNFNKDF